MSIPSGGETPSEIVKAHSPYVLRPKANGENWLLLFIYCCLSALGAVAGPLLQRLYYTRGGSLKWFQSGLQSVGSLVFLPPLLVLYFKSKLPTNKLFFIDATLFYWSVGIGIMVGLNNYLGSFGLSRLPVTTSCLLLSTSLVFTALFAYIIVKQKFTFYSTNSIVAITLGAVVLALHSSSDRPKGVTKAEYFVGFFLILAGAAVGGLCAPLYQLAYSKSRRPTNYIIMMQVVSVVNLTSALFALVGMLINKEFQALQNDAKGFSLGKGSYCLIAVASATIAQLTTLGTVGIIGCKSSLFAGIFSSSLVPITQVASVIAFHEKFTGEKGLSLVLCLWGFTSYFFGEFQMSKKVKHLVENAHEDVHSAPGIIDPECTTQIEMSGNREKVKVQEV